MLALAGENDVERPPARLERPHMATHAEEQELGHIPVVEADASSVRSSILPDLVPDEVSFVCEGPKPPLLSGPTQGAR